MVKTNMLHNINKTLKIIMDDGREVTGKLLVYDQHMNVVLADTVQRRPQTRKMKTQGIVPKRQLGLILLRGEHVVSVTVEDNKDDTDNLSNDINIEKYTMTSVNNKKSVSSDDKGSNTSTSAKLTKNNNNTDDSVKDNVGDAASKSKSEGMKRARIDTS